MWTVGKPEDGPCLGPSSGPNVDRERFRYPIGTIPGNVISMPEHHGKLYAKGTILYQIFEEIIPFIMGALVILFFMCTTIYMGFSLLRLFYSDTLKPYKTRTLKALGKHQHHYRRRESGSSISVSISAHRTSTHSKLSRSLRKTSRGFIDEDGWPLDQTISMTSPPQRKLRPGENPSEYPSVSELWGDDKKPSSKYTGRGGRSGIPIPLNRRGSPWELNPEWSRRRDADQKAIGKALKNLKATQSRLHAASSDFRSLPDDEGLSVPKLTEPVKQQGPVKILFEKDVSAVKQEESRVEVNQGQPGLEPPPLTTPSVSRPQSKITLVVPRGGSRPQSRTALNKRGPRPQSHVIPRGASRTQSKHKFLTPKGGPQRPRFNPSGNRPPPLQWPSIQSGTHSQQPPSIPPGSPLPLKSRTIIPAPGPPPPSPREDPERPLTHVSRHELFDRYTFRPGDSAASKMHTGIPKAEKKPWEKQVMVLRGGPRRKARSIAALRKKRGVEGAGAKGQSGASGDTQGQSGASGDKKDDSKSKPRVKFESEKPDRKQ